MPRFAVLLPLFLALTGRTSADELPQALAADVEASTLRAAEERGRRIWLHDAAASAATDALRSQRRWAKDRRVRGWITRDVPAGIAVTFLDGTPAALYRFVVTEAGSLVGDPEVFEVPLALDPFEMAAAKARSLALASGFQPCSASYNTVVLPTTNVPEPQDWVAYLLPATTKRHVVPLGGTYRLDVSRGQPGALRPYTKTCIALGNPPRVEAMMVTHLLDAVPTDAHVFWSLWARTPMYVATPPHGTIWSIENGQVRLVERAQAPDETVSPSR